MYSPYIGHELSLARRARVPRLLFVDDDLLGQFPDFFPEDATPFVYTSPESGQFRHRQAVEKFRYHLRNQAPVRHREFRDRQAVLLSAGDHQIGAAADHIRDILAKNYRVLSFGPDQLNPPLDNNLLLEALLTSEVCVFLLDTRLTNVDLALAMAHAQFIPSIRLQFNPESADCTPSLSGQIVWSKPDDLVKAFQEQLDGFRAGFVEAINLSAIATTSWKPSTDNLWDPFDSAGLARHVADVDPFVQDESLGA